MELTVLTAHEQRMVSLFLCKGVINCLLGKGYRITQVY
jgi:hypothetical protein